MLIQAHGIFKFKPDAELYYGKPFHVARIHELKFKQELNQLETPNVIKTFNHSQSGTPTFPILKKYSIANFISDLRELNKRILCQLYSIPNIQDLLLRLEVICYGTTVYINIGFYHIEISDKYGASTSTNDSPWVSATVPASSNKRGLNSLSVQTPYMFTSMNF